MVVALGKRTNGMCVAGFTIFKGNQAVAVLENNENMLNIRHARLVHTGFQNLE